MREMSYFSGNLRIEKEWLFFPSGETIKLSQITNMDIKWRPKRKIIRGILIWLFLVWSDQFLSKIGQIQDYYWVFEFLLLFGAPFLLYDSLKYNAHEAITALQVQVTSGYAVYVHSKDYKFLEELKHIIWDSIQTEKENYNINLNNYGIVNMGHNIYNNKDRG